MRSISEARELAELCELTRIVTYEACGRRAQAPRSEDEEPQLSAMVRLTHQELETRFAISVETTDADLSADVSAAFTLNSEAEVEPAALREFLSSIAIMVVYPYLRESIFASASRLGVDPPLLLLFRAGQISFEEPSQIAEPTEK